MPLVGHQRSKRQKACTTAMREQKWLPKHPTTANTVDKTSHRLLSLAQTKHKREMEKVKKLEYNARRREQKVREELKESQGQIWETTEAREELHGERLNEWREEKKSLKKNLARLNAHNRREPLRTKNAVQKALKRSGQPDTAQPIIRYVKKKGVVQNWARNAILTLVNEGVPMSRTWAVMKANAEALGLMIVGSWSFRTSRRVVREGGIAAGLMIVGYALKCIGL